MMRRLRLGWMVLGILAGSLAAGAQEPVPAAASGASSAGAADDALVYKPGGGVAAPVVLKAPEPEYSKEARKDKISGHVLLSMVVLEDGTTDKVKVVRGVGYGLDEKAVEAVKQYRFKPAMRDGKPVKVKLNIEVNFQVFDHAPTP